MTREERKQRTAELFDDALERSPEERYAFLADACAGDEELRKKIENLLHAYAEIGTPRLSSGSSGESERFRLDPDTLAAIGERYDDLEFIGQGGMGVVFRARDREINKVVALKLLHPSLAQNERTIERFRNEIRLGLEITHRNVCRTYSLERFNETILISMEYVTGETLRKILERIKGVSVRQGLLWSQEICEALGAAHERKILHRDLKPENIMIDSDGHVKVMDFGIACSVEPDATGPRTVIGTPKYMSPEQEEGNAGPTSDIYSLGLVLYEVFTGDRRDEDYKTPRQVNPYLPPHIDAAIQKCMERNPVNRFQSALELQTALTKNLGGESKTNPGYVQFSVRSIMLSIFLAALLIGGFFAIQRSRISIAGMYQYDKIEDLVFSPDGHLLASASEDKTVALWDVPGQRRIHTLAGHTRGATAVAFSSNGRWLASGSADTTIKIWEVQTGRLVYTLKDTKHIYTLDLSPDGSWLASTTDDAIKIWDVQKMRPIYTLHHGDSVDSVAFNADGRLLASGADDSMVKVWDVGTGQLVGGPLRHDDDVEVVAFSPDGSLVASGSLDKTIKLWSTTTWQTVQTLWQGAAVKDLAFNSIGNQLLSLGDDGKVKRWEAPTWRESGYLMIEGWDAVSTSNFSADGNTLALGTFAGEIKLQALKAFTASK